MCVCKSVILEEIARVVFSLNVMVEIGGTYLWEGCVHGFGVVTQWWVDRGKYFEDGSDKL